MSTSLVEVFNLSSLMAHNHRQKIKSLHNFQRHTYQHPPPQLFPPSNKRHKQTDRHTEYNIHSLSATRVKNLFYCTFLSLSSMIMTKVQLLNHKNLALMQFSYCIKSQWLKTTTYAHYNMKYFKSKDWIPCILQIKLFGLSSMEALS